MRIFLGGGGAELGGREGACGLREGPFGAQRKHALPYNELRDFQKEAKSGPTRGRCRRISRGTFARWRELLFERSERPADDC